MYENHRKNCCMCFNFFLNGTRNESADVLFGQKWCLKSLDFKRGHLVWSLFDQVWGNLGKNTSHLQKFACSYTYAPLLQNPGDGPASVDGCM